MLPADNWQIREKIKLYNWRLNSMIIYRRVRRDLRRANSQENSLRPLRAFLCALCGKIFLLLALTIIITSCSRKRAPSKGCDCPGGNRMIIKDNKDVFVALKSAHQFHHL
jgi:hypothetical protein